MTSINVFSHDAILSHLQACTSHMDVWDKHGRGIDIFRQPRAVQRLKLQELSSDEQWVQFGKVKKVHIYPLVAGRKLSMACEITHDGIIMKPAVPLLHDRKFLFYTDHGVLKLNAKWRMLSYVKVLPVSKSEVEFTAPNMPHLIVNLEPAEQDLIRMDYTDIFYNDVFQSLQYIDCGQQAADWLRNYLSTNESTVRLAFSVLEEFDFIKRLRDIMNEKIYLGELEPWTEYLMADTLDFIDNIMISTKVLPSLSDSSEHWSSLTAQSNIVIAANSGNTFAQDEWELLRIGKAIIKNLHPLKTRKPRNISDITKRYLVIGLNCKVLRSGVVTPDDKVYITRSPHTSLFPKV